MHFLISVTALSSYFTSPTKDLFSKTSQHPMVDLWIEGHRGQHGDITRDLLIL